MNILVTGAFGFVGSNLSQSLKTPFKHRLIAVDIAEPAKHQYDEFHSWTNLSTIDWSKIDTLIHLAGKAHDIKNTWKHRHISISTLD